jgi:double zinc ribbon protein
MTPLAVFGIDNDGLNLVVNLLILFLVVVWLALVYWTYADARRRMTDPMLIGCAAAASLFPFIGTIVYMIVRPPEYLEDMRERELEIAAAEARLVDAGHLACPYCDFDIEKTFLRCPSCLRRLKQPCGTCGKPLDPRWKICPYCEAEVGEAPAPVRRRARRTATKDQPAVRTAPDDTGPGRRQSEQARSRRAAAEDTEAASSSATEQSRATGSSAEPG